MHTLLTAWLLATAVTAALFVLAVIGQTVWLAVSRRRSASPVVVPAAPVVPAPRQPSQPSRVGAHAAA